MNTHRAVIESYAPPGMDVIASGPLEFCQEALDKWVAHYKPDPEEETPLILEVIT